MSFQYFLASAQTFPECGGQATRRMNEYATTVRRRRQSSVPANSSSALLPFYKEGIIDAASAHQQSGAAAPAGWSWLFSCPRCAQREVI